ncbi:MAG: type II secretion system F family protein [Polyangiaceae bacterium]
MAVFEYRGLIVASGKATKGVRDAENAKSLRALLKREGIMLTEATEGSAAATKQGNRVDLFAIFRRVTVSDVATMTRQLATLVRAGMPLVESVTTLTEQTEKMELLRALTQVRDKLNEGIALAKALEEHPKIFPNLYVNMVAAGEASGTLEQVLERLADFLEDQARLRSKVSAALAYPILMLVMGGGLLAVMMTVVVPKVTGIFASLDRALPWYTQVLIFVSDSLSSPVTGGLITGVLFVQFGRRSIGKPTPTMPLFRGLSLVVGLLALSSPLFVTGLLLYFLGIVLGILATLGVARFQTWLETPKGQLWKGAFLLKLPLFGLLLRLVAVARFTRTLGTLLRSGVPLLKAMDIVRNVVDNARLKQVVDEASMSIREGQSLSAPLKRSGEFPSMSVHMMAVGERSGQLEEMLENIAKEYERQVDTRVQAMTSLLEPLIIMIMGGAVGFITFAILMPLIQMNDFVG